MPESFRTFLETSLDGLAQGRFSGQPWGSSWGCLFISPAKAWSLGHLLGGSLWSFLPSPWARLKVLGLRGFSFGLSSGPCSGHGPSGLRFFFSPQTFLVRPARSFFFLVQTSAGTRNPRQKLEPG